MAAKGVKSFCRTQRTVLRIELQSALPPILAHPLGKIEHGVVGNCRCLYLAVNTSFLEQLLYSRQLGHRQ